MSNPAHDAPVPSVGDVLELEEALGWGFDPSEWESIPLDAGLVGHHEAD